METNTMLNYYGRVYYLQPNSAAWLEIDLILMTKPVSLGEERSAL